MKMAGAAGGAALGMGGGWQHTVGAGAGKASGSAWSAWATWACRVAGHRPGVRHAGWRRGARTWIRARAEEAGVTEVGKDELFASSDVVTVHYKLSPRSVGLVGAAELALMKPTAYLVNTSRGPLVDTPGAVLAALRSGAIAGAALDVYDVEPLPLASGRCGPRRTWCSARISATSPRGAPGSSTDTRRRTSWRSRRARRCGCCPGRSSPGRVSSASSAGSRPDRASTRSKPAARRHRHRLGEPLVWRNSVRVRLARRPPPRRRRRGTSSPGRWPGDVPAVQDHLGHQQGAHVGGRGRGAHDGQLALPGRPDRTRPPRPCRAAPRSGRETGLGGEVPVHQIVGDALAGPGARRSTRSTGSCGSAGCAYPSRCQGVGGPS